ncbi:MAG TPA: DUF937 domain-containing protein [Rudaea sp.]
MSNVVDQVLSHLDDQRIAAIAAQLGTDPQQARTAIEQAIPLIVGKLGVNASAPGGADVLHNVLTNDHAGVDIGGLLGGLLGGGGNNAGGIGGAILGHIFGNSQDAANHGLGQTSGLGSQNAAQLMAILAPIVMAVLGNMTQRQGLSPGGLGGVLAQTTQQIQQQGSLGGGLLEAVLGHGGGSQIDVSHLLQGALGSLFSRR